MGLILITILIFLPKIIFHHRSLMADAAMTVLLETLSHLLLSCSDLISGAEDELHLLAEEVESFRAFLRDAAAAAAADRKSKEEHRPFREAERRIEVAVHDAQDTVDSYLIEPAMAQRKIDLFPRTRQFHITDLVSNLVEDIRSFRVDDVAPLLDKARAEFPDMLLTVDGAILEAHNSFPAFLLSDISNLVAMLGGDLTSGAGEELRLLTNEAELMRNFLWNARMHNEEETDVEETDEEETDEEETDEEETDEEEPDEEETDEEEPDEEEPAELEPLREMKRRIVLVFGYFNDHIHWYMDKAAAAQSMVDLFRRRRDLYRKGVGRLAEVVRSVREDELKPMFEKARIDFGDMLLTADGSESDSTSLQEAPQIRVNKVWSINQDTSVGIEDDQATIIGYLKHETEELDFICIVGPAGKGKTTLARKVYQSQEIQNEFPTRIWVTISLFLDEKDVFLNILKEVTSKDMSGASNDELASTAHHFLEKRKFLLVLDDVWYNVNLDVIGEALPKNNRISKVLITSREEKIGRVVKLSIEPHTMRCLREDESWELIQLQVFGGLHICPPELVEIGQYIARKSGGLPLILVLIGGILSNELSKTQSVSTLNKAFFEVSEYMRIHVNDDNLGSIDSAIKLSCDGLPEELWNSFLYMAVFPEDYEISAATLTRLWIAEGFIRHREGRSLEDVAEENLMHLIQRKLVMVNKMRRNGKVKSCHIHDKVRNFCLEEGKKANLFQEITEFFSFEISPPENMHRRLSVHLDLLELFSSRRYIPTVRSFTCFYKTETPLLPENTSKIPNAFELLRVLDIKHIRFARFPLELTQLFCLRYIVLSGHFKILPEAISMLRNIQTLTIHTSSRTLKIKADIWKMIQLRHLQTNASIFLLKESENHSGQELQTLSNLSPENCTSNVFDRARCMKKLGIRGTLSKLLSVEAGSRNFDNLEMLDSLENLKLLNDIHMVSPSEGRLPGLPPPDKFPPRLKSLTLSATFLSWEHMSVLGMLEKLEVLKLKDNAFVGECWEVVDGGFPSLQVLQIGYTNLVSWKTKSTHFRKLRSLALRNCEKLEALPQDLENILSLEEIELLCPTKAIAAQARKIEGERLQIEGGNFRIKLSIYFAGDE